jgi:hypothetical protein
MFAAREVARSRKAAPGLVALAIVASAACTKSVQPAAPPMPAPEAVAVAAPQLVQLKTPEAFASISDPAERSRANFVEAMKVISSPRCLNCHPNGDSPFQGDDQHVHDPAVQRGPDDRGIPALRCNTCHQDHNLELARVPGAPEWHLAPRQMFWMGRTASSLCMQLKDPARNGGRTLDQIIDHSAHDKLVAWGWNPGWSRTPAPGTQAQFGALIAAWAKDGAACPPEEKTP